ncbi:hypothetical protein Dvar_11580 [Desulfosarcina variabilis str. Montpellier]|uniref:hypothetical protein n=1 Tax=Desulfosarcina variabilis TaxID=2300 RepID=UPI003AFA7E3D
MKKLFIIFAVLCLAAPVMAAEWDFYGSARMTTFRVDVDEDVPGQDSDTDTTWTQQGNSRIGATVKFNDQIGGAFEMSDSFGKRKLYGTYSFGGSELLLGQTYTPTSTQFYSNSVYADDGDLLGFGQFYVGRLPMIQWSIAGFKLAFIQPNVVDYELTAESVVADTTTGVVTTTAATNYDTDVDLPKIEIGYKFKTDMFFAEAAAGYQTYSLDGGAYEYDIDSYVVEIGGGLTLGPVFFNLAGHMGQNLGNYGIYNARGGFDNEADLIAGRSDTNDVDGLGYLAVLGFNISEMFTVEVGYGHEESEIDNSNNTEEGDQYYLNCQVNIAPNFFIVPEIGMITTSDDVTTTEPETFYWGAKWQINF